MKWFLASSTERKITIPEIPSDLTTITGNIDLSSLVFNGLFIVDIKSVNSYDGFIAFVPSLIESADSPTVEEKVAYFEPTINNSRVTKSKIRRLFYH